MPFANMPDAAFKIWESAYKDAVKNGDDKETASKKAWSAVKRSYKKVKGKWVKKTDLLAEMSMYITKATLKNGTMTWAAVNSDTDKDSYGERMSLDLYKDFLANIKKGSVLKEFSEDVCSEFWCGGMPYLSISHYPDLNGKAVPGEPLEIYIDGNQLKAKGILYDSPLGHAVWRSLREDKNKNPEDKIRISIGFLDLAHRHGDGDLFVRDSAYSLCPECLQGIGDKVYVKGHLVHLALTRVPVNKRTEMVLEEKSEMAKKRKTRKDDAESIVGEELAEKIDVEQKATAQKADILIEMSESETEEETQELVEAVESEEQVEEPVAEEVAEATSETVDEPVVEPVEEKADVVEKFDDSTMDDVVKSPEKYDDSYPLNGATSMASAREYMEKASEMEFVMDSWSTFSTVAWNIFAREDVSDKKEMLTKAVDEFRSLLTAKAMVMFAEPEKEHDLKPAIDALLEAVDGSVQKSDDERAEQLNPMLQNLGNAITDYLAKKSDIEQPVPEKNEENILDEIKNLIQPLSESVALLKADVETIKSQGVAATVETKSRVPAPRTAVVPPLFQKKSEEKSTTPKLRDIINRSVGAQ